MRTAGGRGRRRMRRVLLPVCAGLLLAGCASMPSSGEVRKVGDGQRADADTQVRVVPVPPHPGESPGEILDGFLEATTGSEPDFATAKKYLTKESRQDWNPTSGISVFASSQMRPEQTDNTSRKQGIITLTLDGTLAATVDAKHAYQPDQRPFQTSFRLVRQGSDWRIDGLDDGLVMSASDFQRVYHSVNMYYFAKLGPGGPTHGSATQTLVPDPVYLRNQNDPLVAIVATLLGGPSAWLSPVVTTAAPAGAALDHDSPDQGVTLDDSQHLKVRLDKRSANRLHGSACNRLAAQLYATVQAQATADLAVAEVERPDGSALCSSGPGGSDMYGPGNLIGDSPQPYFISADAPRRLMELRLGYEKSASPTASPVLGPFGGTKANLDSVAVRRDQTMAAGVRDNGRELYVGSLTDGSGSDFGQPLATSAGSGQDNGLSAPSWDGLGDLWVADRNPAAPKLMVLPDGRGPAVSVAMPDPDGRIDTLRVSSDGMRVALLVQQGDDTKLELGLVERTGTLEHPGFTIVGLHTLTAPGESVASVSWAGASRMVALDSKTAGVQQTEYMNTDGSVTTSLQGGVGEAVSVAASEGSGQPLLASYKNSVYLLSTEGDWRQIKPKGGSPVYPG